jgi:hypothetical protein
LRSSMAREQPSTRSATAGSEWVVFNAIAEHLDYPQRSVIRS